MKQLLLLAGCVVVLTGFLGCQNDKKVNGTKTDGDKQFPEFLVGVWTSDQFNWVFKFERDGSISKFQHTMGMKMNVAEGGLYEEGTEDSSGVYVLGPCEADYDPQTRQLKVMIILEHFRMELPMGVVEGSSKDYFSGPVSEDGKFWRAKWLNYGTIEGADPPDPNLIEANPVPLIFTPLEIPKAEAR
ncbi:MAG: hypothetical protein FVQ85_21410 [Planctomycetes bacterium]|nr:hypothetical protein [Planctomycetota bacterium]